MSNEKATAPTVEGLPEPVQPGVGEDGLSGKVERITGPAFGPGAGYDPIADLPVIQGDPETKVTRIKGIMVLDAGTSNTLMADVPADIEGNVSHRTTPLPSDRHLTPEEVEKFPVDDRGLRHAHVPGIPADLAEAPTSYGTPIQGDETEVSRVGDTEHNAEAYKEVQFADKPLPEDHPTGVVSQELPPQTVVPKEHLESFKKNEPFKADQAMNAEQIAEQQRQLRVAQGLPADPAPDQSDFIDPNLVAKATEAAAEEVQTDAAKKKGKKKTDDEL